MMKLIEIVELFEQSQKEEINQEFVYLISLSWMRKFIDSVKLDGKENLPMKPINHDIVDETKANILYLQLIFKRQSKIQCRLHLRQRINMVIIECKLVIYYKTLYGGYCIKRQIRNQNQINEMIHFHFIPVHQSQKYYIEGIQQFDSSWNIQLVIQHLETALQNQLSFQIPKRNFIQLYTLKNEKQTNFVQIVQELKEKTLEVEKIEDIIQMKDKKYILMDIKLFNNEFFFQFNSQIIDAKSEEFINQEYLESCRKGLSVFEDQQTLLSCMLKCYENIDAIRNQILQNQNQKYKNLKEILTESYFGFSEYVYYELLDYEFFQEKQVLITKSRYDAVYIYNNENRIIVNNQKNIRQLVESLLGHPQLQCDFNSVLFESSNEYYTEDIDFTKPAYGLKEGYKYQLRKLMWQEHNINNQDRIEIRVHQCTYENIGYQQYKPFAPIVKCYISQWHKFQDLHLLIANLFEEINHENYKESRLNKKYKLYFQTDQQGQKQCTYCQQKLCNNCQVPFNEKALNLGTRVINIYVIYEEIQPIVTRYQPQIFDNYFLRDYFEVDWAQDKILILNINQDQIKPYNLKYYFDSRMHLLNISDLYQLQGIIEKVSQNEYQCYCQKQQQWYQFKQNKFEIVNHLNDDLNVVKLFYIRK
ncbi:unnamed protein product (macronuclear) [Paramecium tetraurelia]|uniref:DUSP domain-containing protein n=1 Tax=Paramecium tetraurelia TaxID=5888 RepID=A0C7Y2_PARTE|nr:uncharacterized protein GSPATT00036030001 [Paramecium tetraurelia]CAK66899.1 unnamed protein product [Paramecium tetraurelia]|eukprot:XP_001434296.1 hypothetical protein (macronuclear) [Paramecium tetraurelia strain d4-2]